MLATTTRFTRSGLASLAGVTRRTFTSQRVLFNASNSDSNGQPPADDPLASILKASMDDKPADTESKASQEQTGSAWTDPRSRARFQAFQPGEAYSPTALLPHRLWRENKPSARRPLLGPIKAKAALSDPFHILSVDPLRECINPQLVTEFVTHMGMIKTRAETGLTWRNQRRVGKMVRRARAMGLISPWTNRTRRALDEQR